MDNNYIGRGEQFVHCREVVHSSECPLSEVPLYYMGTLESELLQFSPEPVFWGFQWASVAEVFVRCSTVDRQSGLPL